MQSTAFLLFWYCYIHLLSLWYKLCAHSTDTTTLNTLLSKYKMIWTYFCRIRFNSSTNSDEHYSPTFTLTSSTTCIKESICVAYTTKYCQNISCSYRIIYCKKIILFCYSSSAKMTRYRSLNLNLSWLQLQVHSEYEVRISRLLCANHRQENVGIFLCFLHCHDLTDILWIYEIFTLSKNFSKPNSWVCPETQNFTLAIQIAPF